MHFFSLSGSFNVLPKCRCKASVLVIHRFSHKRSFCLLLSTWKWLLVCRITVYQFSEDVQQNFNLLISKTGDQRWNRCCEEWEKESRNSSEDKICPHYHARVWNYAEPFSHFHSHTMATPTHAFLTSSTASLWQVWRWCKGMCYLLTCQEFINFWKQMKVKRVTALGM